MGQPASELESEIFPQQPSTFLKTTARFCSARSFAAAVCVAQHAHRVPLYAGTITALRERGSEFEVEVDSVHAIRAGRVDIANGPGPARLLAPEVLSPELAEELRRTARLVVGDVSSLRTNADERVLVCGGGATGAWLVQKALRKGATVQWIARDLDMAVWEEADLAKHQRLVLAREGASSKEERNEAVIALVRLRGFRGADLPRNARVFDDQRLTWQIGEVLRVDSSGEQVQVRWTDGEKTMHNEVYDRLVLALGQAPDQPPGPQALAGSISRLRLLVQDTRSGVLQAATRLETHQRYLGVTNAQQHMRILGAAGAEPWRYLQLSDNDKDELRYNFAEQLKFAPTHSAGIGASIYQASLNIALACGVPLDKALGAHRGRNAKLRR